MYNDEFNNNEKEISNKYEQFDTNEMNNDLIPEQKSHYYTEEIKTKNRKVKPRFIRRTIGTVLLAIIFGVFFQLGSVVSKPYMNDYFGQEKVNDFYFEDSKEKEDPRTLISNKENANYTEYNSPVAEVAEKVSPSIVTISSVSRERDWFYNEFDVEGTGSGIIFGEEDDEILIVTNHHVIANAVELKITFFDDKTADAEIKGYEPQADLAVISVKKSDIESETRNLIEKAEFGDSENLKVGELAIAIGNPLGYSQTVTGGYISGLNREVVLTDKTLELIQTDAAINPGNSGGALVNAIGEVIGINTVKYSSDEVEGIGFAIPINNAKPIIEDIVNQREKAYLGIVGRNITEELSDIYGLPLGINVVSVEPNSPAYDAEIKPSDTILELNGVKTFTMEKLQEEIREYEPGEIVKVKIVRIIGDKLEPMEIEIRLGGRVAYER
ncbi:MAG: S1C family serine protease [Eubacteriales bacterium]